MSPLQIQCSVCGNLVDEILTERDICRMEYVVIVRCHGEQDLMRIGDYELMLFQKQILGQTGKAFTTKPLEHRP